MKIYVARHGQTRWNLEDRVSGRTDIPLTDQGWRQAEQLAEEVAGLDIDLMIVSPLLRAQQTAGVIARRCGIPMSTDERLIEFDFGVFEGRHRTDPEFRAIRRNLAYRYPEGESSFDVAARVFQLLDEIQVKYAGKTILLVCHGALARVLRTYFVDMTNEEFGSYMTDNCKCILYETDCRHTDNNRYKLIADQKENLEGESKICSEEKRFF
ncbi:MAG: histidine phosphatase family protein [Clostridiales bacterium]|nr:histidine phosphatase family protein [Clostridiales bacterium]